MKKLLILLTVLILTQNAFSQQGKGLSNTVDNAGYCYVTGYTTSLTTGNDILVTKYDLFGDTIWTKTYSGDDNTAFDQGIGIKCTISGFVYVVGYVGNINTGFDIVLLKYTTEGNLVWDRPAVITNTELNDRAFGIAVDETDNVYITGSISGTANASNLFIAKYDSSGIGKWSRTYPGQGLAQGNAIVLDHSGNVCVTGFITGSSTGSDIITLKKEPVNGTDVWLPKIYNGQGNADDKAFGIAVDNTDHIYVTGYITDNLGSAYTDIALLGYNPDGSNAWSSQKSYDGGSGLDDKAFGVVVDDLSSVLYITGYTTVSGKKNYVTLKYDLAGGNKLWQATYGGPANNDQANSIGLVKDNSGVTLGVVVTGESVGTDNTNDYATVLYTTSGTTVDSSRYTGTASNDVATQLAVTTSGTIYVTGGSDLLINQRTTAVLKTQQLNWGSKITNNMNNSVPDKYALFQNYPNPFNPSTNIKFNIARASFVKLTIYDMLGREISVPVNQFLQSGTHEISYTNSSLASGTYFYELKTEYFRDVKTMILIK